MMNKELIKKPNIKGKALLKIKTTTKNHCSHYDIFGLCTVTECLTCENSLIKITKLDNDIETNELFMSTIYNNIKKEEEEYFLIFLDHFPEKGELISYLVDEKNNYMIIRKSDMVTLKRPIEQETSKEKVKKISYLRRIK